MKLTWLILFVPVTVFAQTWNGPGANPCRDGCPTDWALSEIADVVPKSVLSEWHSMARNDWPMHAMSVRDGDTILAMGEGGPHMIRKPLRADLEHWEPSKGWTVMHDGDAYLFMIIKACQNPAVIVRRGLKQQLASTPIETWHGPTTHGDWMRVTPVYTHHQWIGPPRETVSVPEPGAIWLFAVAIVACAVVKMRRVQ